jgi:hypothetical protein
VGTNRSYGGDAGHRCIACPSIGSNNNPLRSRSNRIRGAPGPPRTVYDTTGRKQVEPRALMDRRTVAAFEPGNHGRRRRIQTQINHSGMDRAGACACKRDSIPSSPTLSRSNHHHGRDFPAHAWRRRVAHLLRYSNRFSHRARCWRHLSQSFIRRRVFRRSSRHSFGSSIRPVPSTPD